MGNPTEKVGKVASLHDIDNQAGFPNTPGEQAIRTCRLRACQGINRGGPAPGSSRGPCTQNVTQPSVFTSDRNKTTPQALMARVGFLTLTNGIML